MTEEKAQHIVSQWIKYWNEKSLNEYMDLLSDDVEIVSSLTLRLIPESNGHLKGKKILHEYWDLVRKKLPNFKFEFSHLFTYDNKIIVHYTTFDKTNKAIAILTINQNELISKMEISYI